MVNILFLIFKKSTNTILKWFPEYPHFEFIKLRLNKQIISEDNHVMVIEKLKGFSVISPLHEKDVPIWKTRGRYRKEMKRGYSKILYNQRNKDETIVSVIKRLFGEHISSRLIRIQNRELTLRSITYKSS